MPSQQSVEAIGNLLRLAGQNNTEATSTSTSAGDRLSVTGLNIPATTPVLITVRIRKTTGASASAAFGLKINSTVVMEAVDGTAPTLSLSSSAYSGMFVVLMLPRTTNYVVGGAVGWFSEGVVGSPASIAVFINPERTAEIPNAAITDVVIRGLSSSALVTHAVDELRVFTFPSLKG